MHLSVVIPAYNEEQRIIKSLIKVEDYLARQNYSSEVLVIDDGSNDDTELLVRAFSEIHPRIRLLKNPCNQGKGSAVQRGILNAKGEYVLFTDADLSAPVEEVERLFYWVYQGYEVVIGSRNIFDPVVNIDSFFIRKFISSVFNSIVRLFALPQFHDTQCGFKLFKNETAQKLFSLQKFMGFSFDVEILYIAIKNGIKCKEVAVNWKHCPAGKVQIVRDSIRMFKDIIQIKKLHKETEIRGEVTTFSEGEVRQQGLALSVRGK